MDIRQFFKNVWQNLSVKKAQPAFATSHGAVKEDEKQQYQKFQAAKLFERDKNEDEPNQQSHSEPSTPSYDPMPEPKDYRKKDKIALDLLVAVDQMMSDRDLVKQNLDDVRDRLKHSDDYVNKLTQEKAQLEQTVSDKDTEIGRLDDQIANRNMKYDQLMEDYQEMQMRLTREIEELKNNINIEEERYAKLNETYERHQMESISKEQKLEDKIRELETKNENLQKKYYKIREENSYLLGMFKDFNNRMSSSFKAYDLDDELETKPDPKEEEETENKERIKTFEPENK
ncbi:hypothetical protein [Tenuibacillus multivorans]|uniref:Uncharacterized protein n=1 Tax=Tenuibacillus multivorans TaxID=237069 RepID=A0A1G9WRJ4_9BACI|nr:hypothetical protein [Tenuibacillus multivorans]GEL77961.1 hypothetical protein TMU01_21960 [Tenuibacillus multivorans]SDM86999.1 hypothetical protein SAMN05216498_0857 [Tenuibacillus multivorans]